MKQIHDPSFEALVVVPKERRQAGAREPILFLGAGCSIAAGLPGLNELLRRPGTARRDQLSEHRRGTSADLLAQAQTPIREQVDSI